MVVLRSVDHIAAALITATAVSGSPTHTRPALGGYALILALVLLATNGPGTPQNLRFLACGCTLVLVLTDYLAVAAVLLTALAAHLYHNVP